MRTAISDRIFTVEEYIKHEWTSERRHEFINGNLFEMPGEKDINNEVALQIAFTFKQLFDRTNLKIFAHDVKVGIPGGTKYYYPDVFVTREEITSNNRYIKYQPEIVVEVVSESSQIMDYVDKYVDYTKIPSLQYYIIVEPETTLVTVYERTDNQWVAHKYTKLDDLVKLEKLQIEFPVKKIYQGVEWLNA